MDPSANGFAGVVTVDALSTTIGSGQSVALNGNPVTSIAGSTTQFGATVEAYIRKDLVINSGGTATLGMDNALRRLDSGGNNVTALAVNGTFNTGAFSQVVSTLSGSGGLNLNTGGNLTAGENNASSTFSGGTSGNGSLDKVGTGTLTLSGALGHTGATTIQGGVLEFAPASGTQTVAAPLAGAGGVAKSGAGTTVLSGNNTYTGATIISAGTLQAGSSTALGSNSAVTVTGTLNLGGFTVSVGPLAGGGTVTGGGTLTVGGDNASTSFTGTLGSATSVTKVGTGTQTLGGTLSYTGSTTVREGTLAVNAALGSGGGLVRVENSGTLQANASINRSISGAGSGSTITVGATGISLGDSASFTGFSHQGTLSVGANAVTLNSAGFAQLGVLTSVSGGTITAPNGVALGTGSNLAGFGAVNAKVAGQVGSVIQASGGNLALGSNTFGGFVHGGELRTGTNTVTISSLNQATLGSVTTLGDGGTGAGTLTAATGAFVDFGRAVTGFGTVNIGSTAATGLVNNGTVLGTSAAQPITLNGYVKGVGSFGNVVFNGTYSPGLSPALVNVGTVTYAPGNTLVMEIGGTARGTEYDAIVSSGTITFGGTLSVQFISLGNGYAPAAGQSFDLFDWQSSTGTFAAIDLPDVSGSGLMWDTSGLYTTGTIALAPVPEPATTFGLAAAGLGVFAGVRRWRATRRNVA